MHRKTDKLVLTLLHEETTATRFRWLATGLLLVFTLALASCAQTAPLAAPPSSPTLPATPSTPNVSSDFCLACHGPYDKVVKASANYIIPDRSGSTVNPHTTIDMSASKPHASGKGVPECTNCHKPHPQPLVSTKDVAIANGDFCFSCHHQRNFTPCSECHSEGKGGGG